MRNHVAAAVIGLGLVIALLAPTAAFAGSATDAALGLGAFAVFNQMLGGVGVFGHAYAPPPAVVVAPPPPPVAVYQYPYPAYSYPDPYPAYSYPAPPVVYGRGYGYGYRHYAAPVWRHHHHHRGW
jgi:hypothetical protein